MQKEKRLRRAKAKAKELNIIRSKKKQVARLKMQATENLKEIMNLMEEQKNESKTDET